MICQSHARSLWPPDFKFDLSLMPGISRPVHFQKTTPLIEAAQDGHLEDLQLLLDAGAEDINRQTAVGTMFSHLCRAML